MQHLSTRLLLLVVLILPSFCQNSLPDSRLDPTVTIAVLARNAHANLPWFLGAIEQLSYPKNRISIWISTDHNEDETAELLTAWTEAVRELYHHVNLTIGLEGRYGDESGHDLGYWSEDRYDHMIAMRQEGLDMARRSWSDYLLMVDTDQFIYNKNMLSDLIDLNKPIVAPMMNSTSLYTNFWGAVSQDGFYKRSDDYIDILDRNKMGTFEVPMVHSIFLVDLRYRRSRHLKYHPPPPNYHSAADDIIQFAFSARNNDVPMYITNTRYYGYLIPPVDQGPQFLQLVADYGLFIRLHHIHSDMLLKPSEFLPRPPPKYSNKLNFDEVYMINLERRPDRRTMMELALAELGIEYKYFPAVDGRQLNSSYLDELGVKQLDGYLDPYHKRPMKMGEIGCFLSHYFIWKEMEEKGYERILIFEDDVRFRINFIRFFYEMMAEADSHIGGWDLLYIGRKIMQNDEDFVSNAQHLVYPGYTYWTLSYALTRRGMTKFLAQDPISRMIPVDEYLPILFGAHTNKEWLHKYSPRNVLALSANPLFVEPLKYIGEDGYVSDTEDSVPITEAKQEASSIEKSRDTEFSNSDSVGNRHPLPRHGEL
ncbi:glycosyltransferase 25 family member-like isoform X2 [Watersipora subatra]|uniref:glycosyltransferase 25 family member-like isoform X2 n=1 Tax=Watersipora subatra TaxID=2589382 RepID=UPI00355AF146